MTLHSRHVLVVSLVLSASLAACRMPAAAPAAVPLPPPIPVPSLNSRWIATQSVVLQLVAENRAVAADSVLQQFARTYARSVEGDRARWWRTLMRTDARAATGDATLALVQIDSLLSDSVATEVRTEAVMIRRALSAVDSVRRLEIRRRTQATQAATERADDMRATRDSMARLTAEIDRLRKRLRAP
jgi:hypothetical protein